MSRPNSLPNTAPIPLNTIVKNRYLIKKILGQGGLGRTYLAFDTHRFDEPCVIKEFAPYGSGQCDLRKSRELFQREAKILYKISHPQIPKFLACFAEQERLFLAQEYIQGKTYSALLQEYKRQNRVFQESELIEWLMNLLPVLDYLHQNNILHRDISPDNIMQPSGKKKPVLIDFGVGKLTNNNSNLTADSYIGQVSFVGKIGYAPREQISMGICSPSSDIYGLGVTALVLLTAKDPTHLLDRYSLSWQWEHYTQTSKVFQTIVNKMVEEQPQNRYQSAKEVITVLKKEAIDRETTIYPAVGQRAIAPKPPIQEETMIISNVGSSQSFAPKKSSTPQIPQPGRSPLKDEFYTSGTGTRLGNFDNLPPASTPFQADETKIVSNVGFSNPVPQARDTARLQTQALNSDFVKRCRQELSYFIGSSADSTVDEILLQQTPKTTQALINALVGKINDPRQARQLQQRLLH
jgi:serine/threonine protein kinase